VLTHSRTNAMDYGVCSKVVASVRSSTVRVGQNRIYTYIFGDFKPKIPYVRRICTVLANPIYSAYTLRYIGMINLYYIQYWPSLVVMMKCC